MNDIDQRLLVQAQYLGAYDATLDEHGYWKGLMLSRCNQEGHGPVTNPKSREVSCRWCGKVLESAEYHEAVRRALYTGDASK